MCKHKKPLIIIFIIALALSGGGSSFAQATVKEMAGKVEVKPPKGVWGPAYVGMFIGAGSMIGTGFNSRAVLALDGSTLYVQALTRLTLEEIARAQGVIKTNLYIRTGSLEAEVKTGTDYTHDFKVRSPVSTAAVRGTIIRYNGTRLIVKDGKATLFNLLGQPATVFHDDSALSDDGIRLFSSKVMHLLRSRVPLFNRPLSRRPGGSGSTSSSNDTIVIFYPIFD